MSVCMASYREQMARGVMNLNEVLPHLYIGGVMYTDPQTLKWHDIKTVVTIMDCDLPDNGYKADTVQYHYINKQDNTEEDLLSSFPHIVHLIAEGLALGNTLVHCQGGVSRSVSGVMAYMIKVLGLSRDASLNIIQEKRKWAGPNAGFMDQLSLFEQELHWTEEGAGECYTRHVAQIKECQHFHAANKALTKE